MESLKSSCEHTCLPMSHCLEVRRAEEGRGGFSVLLADMIHLTELSSLRRTATHTSVTASLFRGQICCRPTLTQPQQACQYGCCSARCVA